MLSATLSSLAKSSPAWSMGGRRYTTGAASSGQGELTFSAAPVRYSEMLKIKKQRFGRSLEEFKTAHEQPIVQLHAEIRAQKIREQKKLQNREASKSSTLRRRAKKAKKAEISAMDTREFTLQEKLKDLLQEDDLTLAQFMTSGHPKVKEIVEQDDIFENIQMRFDAFDEEAAGSDSWFSVGNLNAAFEPSRFKQDPTERWLWEKHLPDSELTKIISSDVLSCGLPLREDIRSVSTGLDSLNTDDFEQQGHRLSPAPSTNGILKPLNPEWLPVNVSSPAVLSEDQIPLKKFQKKRNRVDFVSHETPFVLETDDFPMLTAMSKHGTKLPVDLIQRKAKLRINLEALHLPVMVRDRLVSLAGVRYKAESGAIVLISDTMPTRDTNISNVYKVASNLLNEAWKADLNYVPVGDNLAPHEQIQRQLELEAEKKAEQAALDPTSFVRPKHFTFFRIASYPPVASLSQGRDNVKQLIQELASS